MMEIGEQYGLPDLRKLMAGKAHFPEMCDVSDPYSGHRSMTPGYQHYGMVMMGGGVHQVGEVVLSSPPPPPPPPLCPQGMDAFGLTEDGGGSQGRWPRQETLTLLEIRSRLDSKFKEAAQKAPLWDEVSRIMADEYGHQRSGKKCREKLENLYKYYKKTKEGKAGRQDGKHYRFFRQLEALYGENNSNPTTENNTSTAAIANTSFFHAITNPSTSSQPNQEAFQAHRLSESLSFSMSTEFDSSSAEEDDNNENLSTSLEEEWKDLRRGTEVSRRPKRGRKSWKLKITEFVDLQIRRFMEVQEAWLEKMLKTLEHKEHERMSREEAWRKQEAARLDKEHKLWAAERAWIKARDASLIEALEKISGRRRELKSLSSEELTSMDIIHEDSDRIETFDGNSSSSRRWPEPEITSLIKLRSDMEVKFREGGHPRGTLWEEISAKMGCLGYDRNAKRCKEKWENINKYFRKTKECNKKRRENSRTCPYYKNLEYLYSSLQGSDRYQYEDHDHAPDTVGLHSDDGPSPSNSNVGTIGHENYFQFLIGEGENLWETHAMKHTGGDD